MSRVGTVAQATQAPQAGVKRPLPGGADPTQVPSAQPGFRGQPIGAPDQPITVTQLSQGNKPNAQTNVPIPLSRVCPLEFLSGYTGRVAPGDVAFVHKEPPGFLSKQPTGANGTNGTATMSRVLGVDGVNRLLHGAHNPDGWAVGHNVLVVDAGASPMQVLSNTVLGGFTLKVLDSVRLDGIVKSNDEPYAFTSNGSRDAVLFNTVIQGPAIVNNGFLYYEPAANPNDTSRGVEAHARGTHEGGYHVGGPTAAPGDWLRGRAHDYVATFTGNHAAYPCQMFDRAVTPMSTLYLGLRAYELTSVDILTTQLRKDADSPPGSWFASQPEVLAAVQALGPSPSSAAVAKAKTTAQAAVLKRTAVYFYQLLPFSSRAAHLCQRVHDETTAIRSNPNDSDDVKTRKVGELMAKINGMLHSKRGDERRSAFDDDPFDAIRTADLVSMVGAWTVGRVLDVAAMRHTAYHGGPADTSFALTVDVQISFRRAFFALGGSAATDSRTAEDVAAEHRQRVEYGTNDVDRNGKTRWDTEDANDPRRAEEQLRKDQLAVDTFNAQFPSMQQMVGTLFGAGMGNGGLSTGTSTPEAALASVSTALVAVNAASSPEQLRRTLQQLLAALPFLQRQGSMLRSAEAQAAARRTLQQAVRTLQERRSAEASAAAREATTREQFALTTTNNTTTITTTRSVPTTTPAARALYARELQQTKLGVSAMEHVRELVDALDPDLPASERRTSRPYPERIADTVTPAVFAADYVAQSKQQLAALGKARGGARTARQRALDAQLATAEAYAAMAAMDASSKRTSFDAARARYQEALDAELLVIRSRLSKTLPRADEATVTRIGDQLREWTQGSLALVQRYVQGAQASEAATEQVYRVLLYNAELRFEVLTEFADAFLSAVAIRNALQAQTERDQRVRREALDAQRGWLADAEERALQAEAREEALDASTRREAYDAQRLWLSKEEERVLREEDTNSPVHQALMQRILSHALVDSSLVLELHHHLHELRMAHCAARGFGRQLGLGLPDAAAASKATEATSASAASVAATAPVVAAAVARTQRQRAKTPQRRSMAATDAAAAAPASSAPASSSAPAGGAASESTSTVQQVFSEIFGTGGLDATIPPHARSVSPTPSSGSDASSGPKTFSRAQKGRRN